MEESVTGGVVEPEHPPNKMTVSATNKVLSICPAFRTALTAAGLSWSGSVEVLEMGLVAQI
jgi:hypothetical protein